MSRPRRTRRLSTCTSSWTSRPTWGRRCPGPTAPAPASPPRSSRTSAAATPRPGDARRPGAPSGRSDPSGPSARTGPAATVRGCVPAAVSPCRPPTRAPPRPRPRRATARLPSGACDAGAAVAVAVAARARRAPPQSEHIPIGEDRRVTDLDERPDEVSRYVASMRRQRRWYFAAIAVVVAAAVAVALVVWSSGEITHVHLHTAKSAAPSVPLNTPPAAPSAKWQSTDATAIGAPLFGGTVVTYSEHTVTGRNALTGVADWTYTRSDRTVCQAAQVQGKTIAIYANGGDCDEVSTFETGTGQRAWTRTLDENGLTVSGRPPIIAT